LLLIIGNWVTGLIITRSAWAPSTIIMGLLAAPGTITFTLLHCICQSYLAFEGRILLFDIGASTMRREHSMTHPTSLPASPSSARPEHSRYFFHGIASHRHCKPLHHSRQAQCLDCGSRRSVVGLRKYSTDPGKAARLLHCSLAYSKCDAGTKAITSLTSIRHPS